MKSYIFLLLFFICISFKAQQIITKVDSATGGKLIINADEEILKMVSEDELCKKFGDTTRESKPISSTDKKPVNRPVSPENICGRRNDIPGFMIKVGEAKTEKEINTLTTEFRKLFPELRVEKSYLRPDWRLLAGDYFKRESAKSDLKRIKRNFPSALLVNWRIYCNRAK
ncbi:SPOR domain-containing protein [Apibacter sp. B3706]|uniref:SPOR domain-containing protein n=1 Tax=Apibacter TaxID=1778601 RepID=UPI0013219F39|nr:MULTISPECIES: SPOR domain-containing protein [Apibacter]MCX8676664.1 SPOR domain-containing protein [Apibacter sp. B3919]MXO24122.1 hypothetical protein [Apibacter sp. B3924]MXO26197.1 hypothetical protein [Apibacter sp. B3813]MXO28148.1 hypothetical protein [Apibacter sp. B3913]MXO30102.1 hypothetical protein [Apibacter sp. B3912]